MPPRMFTTAQVKAIRSSTKPLKALAAKYGCTSSNIYMVQKGRTYADLPGAQESDRRTTRNSAGTKNGNAKLTEADVRRILKDDRVASAVAEDYGVSANMIYYIRKGKAWSYVSKSTGAGSPKKNSRARSSR